MAKQLNVDLRVNADTGQARKQLDLLRDQLQKIQTTPSTLIDDQSLRRASQAASELQRQLKACTDVNTGKLDLARFSTQLNQSGKSLAYYKTELEMIGPEGQKAFLQLSSSIASADAPMLRLNAKMHEFLTTLKNSVRWQISSSIIHGFMGSLQSAYGYAKNLDSSLTNIRTITGYSREEMAGFAKEANKAASALSTTTTAYTDAALIFYQQGLKGEDVTDRVDTVIKMANVTGDAAEEVSSYMTAIWNNFYNGSESLEHYADVITALGASTASSSAEIAAGLEKFAAIAEVTQLSYDYATSALATLVANTRQSADVVGTSLKTIFSRLESVKLGETLEDGVELTKYSEALQKIGVHILDASGEMRNLDDILDDTAAKWDTLTRAQKMATAQTVAGVRQYNNFISLMDNWDDMQANLSTASNAEGELDEQAERWADSWEGARNRVRAATQGIYDELLDEDVFIAFDNALASLLNNIAKLVQGLGGMKGILFTIGGFITQKLAKEAPVALEGIKSSLQVITGQANSLTVAMQKENQSLLSKMEFGEDSGLNARIAGNQKLSVLKQNLIMAEGSLSSAEHAAAEVEIADLEAQIDLLDRMGQRKDELLNKANEQKLNFIDNTSQAQNESSGNQVGSIEYQAVEKKISDTTNRLQQLIAAQTRYNALIARVQSQANVWEENASHITESKEECIHLIETMRKFISQTSELDKNGSGGVAELKNKFDELDNSGIEPTKEDIQELIQLFSNLASDSNVGTAFVGMFEGSEQGANDFEVKVAEIRQELLDLGGNPNRLDALIESWRSATKATDDHDAALDRINQKMPSIISHSYSFEEALTSISGAAMMFTGAMNSASGAFEVLFNDENATTAQKISSAIGLLTTSIMLLNAVGKASAAVSGLVKAGAAGTAIATKAVTAAKIKETGAVAANTVAWYSNPITAIIAIAVTGLAIAIGVLTKKMEEQTAKIKEHSQAASDDVDTIKSQTSSNEELIKSFLELHETYEETGEVSDELKSYADQLNDAYEDQSLQLDSLNGRYDTYIQKLKDAREEEVRNAYNRVKHDVNDIGREIEDADEGSRTYGDAPGLLHDGDESDYSAAASYMHGWNDPENAEKWDDAVDSGPSGYEMKIQGWDTAEEFIHVYEGVQDLYDYWAENMNEESFRDSTIVDGFEDFLRDKRDLYDRYISAQEAAEELQIEANTLSAINNFGNDDEINNLDDYYELRDEIVTKTAEEQKLLDSNGNIISGQEEHYQRIVDSVDRYLEDYKQVSEFSKQAQNFDLLEQTYEDLDIDAAKEYFDTLSDDKKSLFFQIDFNYDNWDEQLEELRRKGLAESIPVHLELMDIVDADLEKNGSIGEKTRESLEAQYGAFMDWDKFDASDVIDQLQMIQELEEEGYDSIQHQADLVDEYNDLLNQKITLENGQARAGGQAAAEASARLTEINERLNEIKASQDFDINFNIDDAALATIESRIGSITSMAQALQISAEAIGEGFIVAADDAQVLANVYPQLLDNAYVYEDGRVQLDKATVQEILGNDSAILEGDTATVKGQLDNKIALLDAEINYYETKRDLLQQAMQGEISYEDLQTGLAEAGNQFKVDMEEWAAEAGMNADYISTTLYLDNLDKLDERIEEVSRHYSKMLSGDIVEANSGSITASQGDSIEYDYEGFDGDQDAYKQWLQEQLDATNGALDQLQDERADLIALEARLGKDVADATTAMGNAAAGLGGKFDKSKSSNNTKEKSTKDLKNLDDEIERYHEIKELLEDIEAEVNKFSKAKDRAWGAGKIANINKEINALNKQKAALQEYQRQAKSYMSSDAAKAASYGWSIGADGNISNYDANMAAITAEYNAAVAAYNSTEAGSDAEKAAGKNVEAAQKKFDEAKKALQKYEESADLVRDLEQQIIDASYEIADLKLEAIEYTIELKLDFDERQLKLFEDIMKDFGDMADHALDKITEIEKCIGVIFDEMATNKDGISQMLGLAGVSGGTIADLINGGELSQGQVEEIAKKMQEENGDLNYDQIMSDIEGYMDKLIDLNDQLREYREQVFATLEAAIDEYIDDLDRANDKIAKITKLTQGYKDLIQSIGKANVDATGELTKALNKALEDEAKSAITAAKAKEDFAKTTLDDAKALYQTAVESGDEWAINRAEEVLKKAEDEYATALEESQDATKAFVDAVATSFKDSIEQVITDLDKNLGGLKHLREQFDQSKELDAQYIEDYTKIYELSKLTRQVQSSMDETDNIRAKKELLEFQKEINAYQEQGVQMSEYELEYLQKRYELKLAEIALQEAQNAKSQVSMVQDNEGNYSYVYTADDQAVADAQQNYEDKLYALQLLNGQYINELQNNIITMQEEMSAKLQEIADDETLSQEERMERIEETREYYLERLAFYDEQLALSLDNNKSLYENEWLDYHEKTGYKISANKDYVDSWEETSLAILTNVKTQGEYMNMLQEYLTQAANTARDCCQESINKLNEVGLTTNNLTIIVNGATAQLTSDAQAIAAGAQMMSTQYQSSINQIMASVQAFTAQYASMISQSIANNQRLIASMQMVIQMAAAMAAALGAHVGGTGGVDPGSGDPGNSGPGSNTPGNGQDPGSASKTADAATIAGIAASIWMDGQKSGWGNDPIRSGKVSAEYNAATATAVQQYINQHGPNGDIYSQWAGNRDELKKYYASYDTGGYTGAWGTSEGKLAMLHQKELVLNAADTSNMLAIVDMVRDISSMIDLNAMSSMINTGLSAITANLNNEGTLEQEVHITAEFPNATDKNEILEAFDNVINLAAQYANRK